MPKRNPVHRLRLISQIDQLSWRVYNKGIDVRLLRARDERELAHELARLRRVHKKRVS